MNKETFENLIKKAPYHFFVCYTHTSFPISLAIHTYIIIVKNGEIKRWDLCHFKDKKNKPGKHLFTNHYLPLAGLPVFPWGEKWKFKGKLLSHIKGDKASLAYKAITTLEYLAPTYRYKDRYIPLPGPNSNSFTQWIIDQIPGIDIKLPWNAFGKNYFRIWKR